MITIIDYGMGNLGSVLNMFRRIGVRSEITANLEDIRNSEKLLLPGVGAFDAAMTRIDRSGLSEIINYKAKIERVPILGICLGMQLLTRSSEEGERRGLGLVDAVTRRFPSSHGIKIPHMGWNVTVPTRECRLTQNLSAEPRFYFVHSFYVSVACPDDSILRSTHGLTFDAALNRDNIYGAQFHPEKSHKFGMQFLKNFAEL